MIETPYLLLGDNHISLDLLIRKRHAGLRTKTPNQCNLVEMGFPARKRALFRKKATFPSLKKRTRDPSDRLLRGGTDDSNQKMSTINTCWENLLSIGGDYFPLITI
jgi:hypothetical protein